MNKVGAKCKFTNRYSRRSFTGVVLEWCENEEVIVQVGTASTETKRIWVREYEVYAVPDDT